MFRSLVGGLTPASFPLRWDSHQCWECKLLACCSVACLELEWVGNGHFLGDRAAISLVVVGKVEEGSQLKWQHIATWSNQWRPFQVGTGWASMGRRRVVQ